MVEHKGVHAVGMAVGWGGLGFSLIELGWHSCCVLLCFFFLFLFLCVDVSLLDIIGHLC